MRSLKEILLPTDLSPLSALVARYAAGVARRFHSGLTLFHVLPAVNPAWVALGNVAVADEALARRKKETREDLNVFLTGELGGLEVKRIVAEGDPAELIETYVRSKRIGLIMMPTRGCSALRRLLLGSVTAKVLNDVNCPVWTISHIIGGLPAVSAVPKLIVCAVDLTPGGDALLLRVTDLAWSVQARLIVVHAVPALDSMDADMRRAFTEDAHAGISEVLRRSKMPGAEVCVMGGSVSTAVRSAVESSRADLLIIGRASDRGMFGRLRTHSYTLIRESPCPVISI